MGYLVEKTGLFLRFTIFFLSIFLFVAFPLSIVGEESVRSVVDSDTKKEGSDVLSEETPIDIADGDNGKNSIDGADVAVGEFRLKNEQEQSSYALYIFRLVFSLAFVVVLAYVVIRLMRRSGRFSFSNDDSYLKLVANLNIEQGKSIKIFTLGNMAYVIGVTNHSITKIAEVEDKDLVSSMNLKADEESSITSSSFSSVFSAIFPARKSSSKVQDASAFNDDFLRSQQDRIKNINLMEGDEFNEVREERKLE